MKRVMVSVLCLLLLLAAVGAALYFYPTIRDKVMDVPEYTVTYDGGALEDAKDVYCSGEEPLIFEVGGKYKAFVNVNPDKDFVYTVNGFQYHFKDLTDVSAAFDIKADGEQLTVTPAGDLAGIIAKLHAVDRDTVDVSKCTEDSDLFIISFSDDNGKHVQTLSFAFYTYDVFGVKLSDKELKF